MREVCKLSVIPLVQKSNYLINDFIEMQLNANAMRKSSAF